MARGAAAGAGAGVRLSSAPGRWVLSATVLGSGVAAIDATVVGIALPSVGRDFGVGVSSLQWVVTAYMITLAGLLLLGGGLGDRLGRRKIFVVGVAWFAIASLLCGLAPSAQTLIAARALQGVGAALLTPGSLAIIEASFVSSDRARAIGAWSGLGGVATAVGPFLGGYLISAVSWRLVFFINLPIALAVILISLRHVPESGDPSIGDRLDLVGAVLITLGLVGVTYGLIEAPDRGWASAATVASLVTGAVCVVSFVLWELRVADPLLNMEIFRSRQFSATNMVTFVIYGALGGVLFLLPIQLQEVAHYTPVESGTALLPLTFIMLALSARSAALAARIGPRLQMSLGPIVAAVGIALLTLTGPSGSYLTDVLPAVVLLGLGLAITVAPLTATALSSVPLEHAGIASAVNNDVARSASLMAVAVLPAIAGITGSSYLHPAEFSSGFHTAVLVAAGATAAGGILAAFTIRNPRPDAQRAPELAPTRSCPLEAAPLHACALEKASAAREAS